MFDWFKKSGIFLGAMIYLMASSSRNEDGVSGALNDGVTWIKLQIEIKLPKFGTNFEWKLQKSVTNLKKNSFTKQLLICWEEDQNLKLIRVNNCVKIK